VLKNKRKVEEEKAREHKPRVVFVDEKNRIV